MKNSVIFRSLLVIAAVTAAAASQAQIKVGVIVSATGPAAALGMPQQKMASLFPTVVAGQEVKYIVMDDASDSNQAAKVARKLTSEDNVDVIVGPSVNATAFAVLEVAAETKTPMITMAPGSGLTSPVDAKRQWVFKAVMDEKVMAEATVRVLASRGVKSLGVMASSESYGESWVAALPVYAAEHGIVVHKPERFGLADVAATGQTIRLLSAKPDAVLIAGISTTAAMPHKALKERGYAGSIFQTYGSLNNEFLKVGGRDVEGAVTAASSKFLVLDELPDTDPVKQRMGGVVASYEKAYGKGSAVSYIMSLDDARQIAAFGIDKALQEKRKPGTPEFRQVVRDAIENAKNLQLSQSRVSFSPTNHTNIDRDSVTFVTVTNGKWTVYKQ